MLPAKPPIPADARSRAVMVGQPTVCQGCPGRGMLQRHHDDACICHEACTNAEKEHSHQGDSTGRARLRSRALQAVCGCAWRPHRLTPAGGLAVAPLGSAGIGWVLNQGEGSRGGCGSRESRGGAGEGMQNGCGHCSRVTGMWAGHLKRIDEEGLKFFLAFALKRWAHVGATGKEMSKKWWAVREVDQGRCVDGGGKEGRPIGRPTVGGRLPQRFGDVC